MIYGTSVYAIYSIIYGVAKCLKFLTITFNTPYPIGVIKSHNNNKQRFQST